MKTNYEKPNYCYENATANPAGTTGCETVTAQIETAKNQVSAEFSERLEGHESVLRLALSEAEALAWETNYPYLVFATLAMEKAQAAATWETRQQLLTRHRLPAAPVTASTQDHV